MLLEQFSCIQKMSLDGFLEVTGFLGSWVMNNMTSELCSETLGAAATVGGLGP